MVFNSEWIQSVRLVMKFVQKMCLLHYPGNEKCIKNDNKDFLKSYKESYYFLFKNTCNACVWVC